MAISIQAAIGDSGRKAVTELSNYDFNSLAVINGFSFGANSNGLFKLNTGTTDADTVFTSSFILATSDFGIKNPKRLRYFYIGIETDNVFIVSIKADNQSWRNYTVTPLKTGLQRVRIPVGSNGQGRYWTIKISSSYWFRIDNIDALTVNRSSGIKGY